MGFASGLEMNAKRRIFKDLQQTMTEGSMTMQRFTTLNCG